jgi:UDP-N-acetylglucosamine 1-carboxyvinyltransferase
LHLKGLTALGARLRIRNGYVIGRAPRLRGATIDLSGPRGPTVTGTANVLSAAVLARGTTILHGAAREPEIVDLGRMLISMGARVSGLGTATIRVEGVDQLGGTALRVIPDRIEAATLLLAAAVTRGSATVTGVAANHLGPVLVMLRAAGTSVEVGPQQVSIDAEGPIRPIHATARPYPGLPTDLQAQWTALLATAAGRSRVRDEVFPDRFSHVAELRRLGADLWRDGPAVEVVGVDRLRGAPVVASDLRASAALVLAGLAAEGQTVVEQVHHLDRGYERLEHKLSRLGARIERTPTPSSPLPQAAR